MPGARFYVQNTSAFLSFSDDAMSTTRQYVSGGLAETSPPNRMDGAFVVTSSKSADLDPVDFTLEGSDDGENNIIHSALSLLWPCSEIDARSLAGETWKMIACASYWRTKQGKVVCRPKNRYPTPTERQTTFVIDMRPQKPWILLNVVLPFWDSVSLVAVSFLASLERAQHARHVAGVATFVSFVIHLAACLTAAAAAGQGYLLSTCWLAGVARFLTAFSVMFETLPLLLVADILWSVTLVVEGTYDTGSYTSYLVASQLLLFMFSLLYLTAHHRWTVRALELLVKPDMDQYRIAWEDLKKYTANTTHLHTLAELVQTMEKSTPGSEAPVVPRHYNRARNHLCSKKPSNKMIAMFFSSNNLSHGEEAPTGPHNSSFEMSASDTFIRAPTAESSSSCCSGSSHENNASFEPNMSGDCNTSLQSVSCDCNTSLQVFDTSPAWKRRNAFRHTKSITASWSGMRRKSISFEGEDLLNMIGKKSSRNLFTSFTQQDIDSLKLSTPGTQSKSSSGEWYAPLPTLVRKVRDIPGTKDLARPVQSLDQVYKQAVGMDGELRLKVQNLSLQSGGYLPVKSYRPEGGYDLVRWQEIVSDPLAVSNVCWAKLKSQRRAVEKLFRSYKGDVSRLVDVVRQCIVFDHVGQIVECLRAFEADKDLIVERIKNRLHPEYDDERSAGYRDVQVNLRIDNESTRRLGIELHVCELQLVLRSFYELKSDEGHKRYVMFRNGLGE